MVRGNNKEPIFSKKSSKIKYINLLNEHMLNNNVQLVAWCIMNNHAHLVLKSEITELQETMSITNTKFAMIYNYINDRVGHVFQDRYKSEQIETDEYLMNVVRYVHNNPVKANIVDDADDYEWSSYKEYFKTTSYISDEQKQFILQYFNKDNLRFTLFHSTDDINIYLDTQEDKELFLMSRAQSILSSFCRLNGIRNAKQLYKDNELLEQLITELLSKTKLSQRAIAKLIGTKRYKVDSVAKKINTDLNINN